MVGEEVGTEVEDERGSGPEFCYLNSLCDRDSGVKNMPEIHLPEQVLCVQSASLLLKTFVMDNLKRELTG
jgi:hypothetical protein